MRTTEKLYPLSIVLCHIPCDNALFVGKLVVYSEQYMCNISIAVQQISDLVRKKHCDREHMYTFALEFLMEDSSSEDFCMCTAGV